MPAQNKDLGAIGRAIYKNKILKTLDETADKGKLVVIDVNSGDYVIADDDLSAMIALRDRRPDAFFWVERIGYSAPYSMGGSLRLSRL